MIEIIKQCTKCGIKAFNEEGLELFNKDKRLPYGRTSICKKCCAIKHNKWMRDNRDKLNNWRRIDFKNKQEKLASYIGGIKCNKCGFTHSTFAPFDFHHIDPSTKDVSISDAINRSWNNLVKEVDKCILLCATCHRLEHERLRNDSSI